jgi:Extensin-like protein C-terminus
MAAAVAQWIRDDIAPATTKIVGARLRGLENMGSYECRGRDRVRGATLSEHGRANALDVHSFKFANGATLVLADLNASKEFRDAVRTSACAHFATVLGPGSDEDHAEHVHIDLEPRRNDYKICEWDVIVPIVQAKAKAEPDAQATPMAEAEAAPIPLDQVPLPLPRPVVANLGRRVKER